MATSYEKQLKPPFKLSVLMPVHNERFLVEHCVERVLAFEDPLVREVELIVVDDGSTDGSQLMLRRLARTHADRICLIELSRNQGKGAAVRQALARATGELTVIQDSDLEYNPADWHRMLRVFVEANADAVYGSRFAAAEYRRVLYFWHTVGNRLITLLSNLMTDLNLTDIETCYKMVRTELLRSIPLRSDDFRIEPELTAKLAKRGAVIYEVPVTYAGRTYQEGKKIGARDGLRAVAAILKWKLLDDLYQEDEYGSAILSSLTHVHRFNRWMADQISPDVGGCVLEIGAGIGNITRQLLPREEYLATDVNPHYLAYLHSLSLGKPYLRVAELDLLDGAAFRHLRGRFDTVLCLNVLEHVEAEGPALANIFTALKPGGKAIVLVPQGQWLFNSLDRVLQHVKRYDRAELKAAMEAAGFDLESLRDYNRISLPGWLINGTVLRRTRFSPVQLKLLNTLTPLLRRIDDSIPWHGTSLIAVGQKPLRQLQAVSDDGDCTGMGTGTEASR